MGSEVRMKAGVTVKLASGSRSVEPEALIASGPFGEGGTVTSAVHSPRLLAVASVIAKLSPTMTVIRSLAPAPEPVTFIAVPGDPKEGSRLMMPDTTVNFIFGMSVSEVSDPNARMV